MYIFKQGALIMKLTLLLIFVLNTAALAASRPVYYVEVKGTVNPGLANYVTQAVAEAEAAQAGTIVLEINTPGGLIDSALSIKQALLATKIPTVAYVREAFSAGALLALACDDIVMEQGSAIGAAEPRLLGVDTVEKADPKTMSAWRAEMVSTAQANDHDARLAAAMVDAKVTIANVTEGGEPLTLTAKQAHELGLAEQLVTGPTQVLAWLGADETQLVPVKPALAEQLAQVVTDPVVSPILLVVGLAGIVLELFTVGFGLAGLLGFLGLGFFFGGHLLAGLAGWEAVVVFGLGLLALLAEIVVIPGFGVAGVAGTVLLVWSIFLVSVSPTQAMVSLIAAFLGTVVVVGLGIKFLQRRAGWERLILGTRQSKSEGYKPGSVDQLELTGLEGITVTPLRPAGTALFGEQRVDVVSEGDFVPVGCKVVVLRKDGNRLMVRKVSRD